MAQYSEKLIEHFSNPRNVGEMEDASVRAVVKSPVCGDQLHLFVKLDGAMVIDASYVAYGCAGALATGSVLTELLVGKTMEELSYIREDEIAALLGGLTPAQRHCASMGCEAVGDLLKEHGGSSERAEPGLCGCQEGALAGATLGKL